MRSNSFFVILCKVLLINQISLVVCNNPSTCAKYKQCDDCIGVKDCSWCTDLRDPTAQFQRCNTFVEHANNRCSKDNIIKGNSSIRITKNDPISRTMRIQPQRAEATLGASEKVDIELVYRDSGNKPLDLYYIMDLSHTMKDDKETVSAQARDLKIELEKITENVQLGFGSFIDKPILPFVSAGQLRGEARDQDIPYGFKNSLRLTRDADKFEKIVKEAKISANLDEPEGTLDALMQAITCTNEIGWRDESSKLIVVATDGPFHIAGDGKLVGIVRPNDMKCHLENGMYTHSTKLDYPTIGELNAVILKHKVFVIFAVSKTDGDDTFSVYEELEKHLSFSAAVQLEKDSRNVVEKVKTKYKEIRDTVKLNVEKAPKHVEVKVKSKCSLQSTRFSDEDECSKVEPNSEIRFKLTLDLKQCPDKRGINDDEIVVSFFQLTQGEKLRIKLNYNCDCKSCNEKKNDDPFQLERYCSGTNAARYISCGSCACAENRYGDWCQCSILGNSNQGNLTNCIDPNGNDQAYCSNRGKCKCGQCECESQEYNGKYCQDSTAKCQNPQSRFPTKLCSDKGHCVKGECHCSNGYEGKYCECQTSKKLSCVEPGRSFTDLCNGHGTCECSENGGARCICDSNYGGLYCDVCKNCQQGSEKSGNRCNDKFLQDCVKCRVEKFNEAMPQQNMFECSNKCPKERKTTRKNTAVKGNSKDDVSSFEFVELTEAESLEDKTGTKCMIRLNSSCSVDFRYSYLQRLSNMDDVLQVYYKPRPVNCDAELPLLWYIFGIIIGVLFAGILCLLVWKLATHFHDRREYQKFDKERARSKWVQNENPLYNKPMSEFENPAYRN